MFGNWIRQTTTTTGTGNLTLSSVSGYPTFADEFATDERFAYVILDDSTGAPIERGIGYMNSTPELVREAVLATYVSSTYTGANPSAVTLASGTKRVICTGGAHSAISAAPGVWANGVKGYGPASANAAAAGTLTLVADQAYMVPFRAETDADIDAVVFRVTTAGGAGKLAKAAIYSVGRDGLPGVQLAISGSVAVDGATGNRTCTFTRFRPPPAFFVGLLCDGAPVVQSLTTSMLAGRTMGASASLLLTPYITQAGATGLTFPTSWAPTAVASNVASPVLIARNP